jgi:hypothetical protein
MCVNPWIAQCAFHDGSQARDAAAHSPIGSDRSDAREKALLERDFLSEPQEKVLLLTHILCERIAH